MDKPKLDLTYVPLDSLTAAPYNPRTMKTAEFEALQRSLDEFGWAEPIVVNKRSGFIVGGHMRANAARAIGMTEAPVIYVDLDEQKERALNIALNKIAGEFDEGMLTELIAGLDEDLLSLTGFDDKELEALQADPFDEPEADKKPTEKKYTLEELRTLAKGIYPAEADTILDFLQVVENASK